LGFSLLGNKKEFRRGMIPPGQHGQKKTKKRKISLYAAQNREKQKLRFTHGLKEKQLKNLYLELEKKEGNTIQHILNHLIPRLDKVIFRSGLVSTYL